MRSLLNVMITGATLALATGAAQATVLTFETATGLFPNNSPLPQDYGDNVVAETQGGYRYGTDYGATPDITVDWGTGAGPLDGSAVVWNADFGDLEGVIEAETEPSGLQFTLTAAGGNVVELYGFDMAGWPQADYTINAVRVRDGDDQILYEALDVTIAGAGPSHTDFDFAQPLVAEVIKIEWDSTNLGGSSDNIGMDNIAFGQNVPEPTSAVLLVLAAALLMTRRR